MVWHVFITKQFQEGLSTNLKKNKNIATFIFRVFFFFNERSSLVRDEMSLAINFQARHTPNKRIAEEASSAFFCALCLVLLYIDFFGASRHSFRMEINRPTITIFATYQSEKSHAVPCASFSAVSLELCASFLFLLPTIIQTATTR